MPNGLPQLPSVASLVAPLVAQENAVAGVLSQIGLPQPPPGPAGILSTLPPLPGLGTQAGAARARGGGATLPMPGTTVVNY